MGTVTIKERTNATKKSIEEALDSTIKNFSTMLDENLEKLMRSKPKIELKISDDEPYIKYDFVSNSMLVVGKDIKEKFIRYVFNGVIASIYFQEKQRGRTTKDQNFSNNSYTENMLRLAFSSLFNSEFAMKESESNTLAGSIFSASELSDIDSLKGMMVFVRDTIASGKFEQSAQSIMNGLGVPSAELVSRVLAVVLTISNNGDVKKTLKGMYYNGYLSLNSVVTMNRDVFMANIATLFTRNAS